MRKSVEQLSPLHILPEISYIQAKESWIVPKHGSKLKQTKKKIKKITAVFIQKSHGEMEMPLTLNKYMNPPLFTYLKKKRVSRFQIIILKTDM